MLSIEKFDEMFQCSICFETMSGSIMGCPEGHNVCDECHAKWQSCALCRNQISVRNRQMEGFRDGLSVACACTQILATKDLFSHLTTCAMQPMRCPLHTGTNAACLNLTRANIEHHIQKHHPDVPFLRLCLGPITGGLPSFNSSSPEWKMGVRVKVVPSDDASAPTIVCLSLPDDTVHSVIMMHRSGGTHEEEVVTRLKSYIHCVNGIALSTSTLQGGEMRAIHRQFRCNEEIRVRMSFDSKHSSLTEVFFATS